MPKIKKRCDECGKERNKVVYWKGRFLCICCTRKDGKTSKERRKEMSVVAKDIGMCIYCFKESVDVGHVTCPKCRFRIREWHRIHKKTKKVSQNGSKQATGV